MKTKFNLRPQPLKCCSALLRLVQFLAATYMRVKAAKCARSVRDQSIPASVVDRYRGRVSLYMSSGWSLVGIRDAIT